MAEPAFTADTTPTASDIGKKRPLSPSATYDQLQKRLRLSTAALNCLHCGSQEHDFTTCKGQCMHCSVAHPCKRCPELSLEFYTPRGFCQHSADQMPNTVKEIAVPEYELRSIAATGTVLSNLAAGSNTCGSEAKPHDTQLQLVRDPVSATDHITAAAKFLQDLEEGEITEQNGQMLPDSIVRCEPPAVASHSSSVPQHQSVSGRLPPAFLNPAVSSLATAPSVPQASAAQPMPNSHSLMSVSSSPTLYPITLEAEPAAVAKALDVHTAQMKTEPGINPARAALMARPTAEVQRTLPVPKWEPSLGPLCSGMNMTPLGQRKSIGMSPAQVAEFEGFVPVAPGVPERRPKYDDGMPTVFTAAASRPRRQGSKAKHPSVLQRLNAIKATAPPHLEAPTTAFFDARSAAAPPAKGAASENRDSDKEAQIWRELEKQIHKAVDDTKAKGKPWNGLDNRAAVKQRVERALNLIKAPILGVHTPVDPFDKEGPFDPKELAAFRNLTRTMDVSFQPNGSGGYHITLRSMTGGSVFHM